MPNPRLADEFSELCKHGTSPDVFAFLDANPGATERDRLDVLLVDQYHRWQAGRPRAVESYWNTHPQLDRDDDLKIELIAEEFGYLEERDGQVDRQAFLDGFRDLSAAAQSKLRELLPESSNGDHELAKCSRSVLLAEPRRQIGRYEVIRQLGTGSFGVVYLALDSQLKREVAIKVPSQGQVDQAGGADAFLREARVVAGLDHSAIVPVYDVGKLDSGECYVVSKYIEGQHLGERMQERPLSHSDAVQLVAAVARALHSAHQNGLVHRDVKPANILVDADDQPNLVDFGLALREEEFGRGATLVGTPAYMSPEQARGEGHRVDARSDIYSLGVVLYER